MYLYQSSFGHFSSDIQPLKNIRTSLPAQITFMQIKHIYPQCVTLQHNFFHFLDVFLWCPSNLERLRWILPLPSSLTGIVLLCRLFMDWSFFISILYLVLVGTSLVTSSSACSSEAPCLETTSFPPQLSPVCGCFSCYTLSETFFALSIYRYCIYICVHVYFTSLPRDLYSFLVFSSLTFSHPHSHAGGCVNGLWTLLSRKMWFSNDLLQLCTTKKTLPLMHWAFLVAHRV